MISIVSVQRKPGRTSWVLLMLVFFDRPLFIIIHSVFVRRERCLWAVVLHSSTSWFLTSKDKKTASQLTYICEKSREKNLHEFWAKKYPKKYSIQKGNFLDWQKVDHV